MTLTARLALLFLSIWAIGERAMAQSFDGEWRGTGKCKDAGYTIVVSVQNNAVVGAAQSFGVKAGYAPSSFSFRGRIEPTNGVVVLAESASGTNRFEGRVNGGRLTFKGWTGELTCEYALDRTSAPTGTAVATTTSPSNPLSSQSIETGSTAKPLPTSNPERDAFSSLPPAEMSEVQRALKQLGHYAGIVDGTYGPGTEAGVRAWQRSRGMPQTGYLPASQIALVRRDALASVEKRSAEASRLVPAPSVIEPSSPSPVPPKPALPAEPPRIPKAEPLVPATREPATSTAPPPTTQEEVERLRKQVAEAREQARAAQAALAEATRKEAESLARQSPEARPDSGKEVASLQQLPQAYSGAFRAALILGTIVLALAMLPLIRATLRRLAGYARSQVRPIEAASVSVPRASSTDASSDSGPISVGAVLNESFESKGLNLAVVDAKTNVSASLANGAGDQPETPPADFINRMIHGMDSRDGFTTPRQWRDIALILRVPFFFIFYYVGLALPVLLEAILFVTWMGFEVLSFKITQRLKRRFAQLQSPESSHV